MKPIAPALEPGHVLDGNFHLFSYGSDDFYKVSFECSSFGDSSITSSMMIPLGRVRFSDFTWFKPEKVYAGRIVKQLVYLGEEDGINYFGAKQLTHLFDEFRKLPFEKQDEILSELYKYI